MKEPERDGAPENRILLELSEPQKPGRLEGPARARATFVRPPGDRSMPRFANSPVPPLFWPNKTPANLTEHDGQPNETDRPQTTQPRSG